MNTDHFELNHTFQTTTHPIYKYHILCVIHCYDYTDTILNHYINTLHKHIVSQRYNLVWIKSKMQTFFESNQGAFNLQTKIQTESIERISETEKQRERERSEIMGVGSEFLPFILTFLGDDSIKIVALFFENRRPR